MKVVEPCACGGFIEADTADPGPAVALHGRTERHLRWRGIRYHQCAGVEGATCVVSIPASRRLCHYCVRTQRLLNQRAAVA